MEKKEYMKLVKEYGDELAKKAMKWFIFTCNENFRKNVKQAQFIIDNEYIWRNP